MGDIDLKSKQRGFTVTPGTTVGIGGIAISASCGSFSTNSATFSLVTNFSLTITTAGLPVKIYLISDGVGANCGISSDLNAAGTFRLLRNGTVIYSTGTGLTQPNFPASAISHLDVVAAGVYTYTAEMAKTTGPNSVYCAAAKMVVHEMYF
jgi:hypothetical protein